MPNQTKPELLQGGVEISATELLNADPTPNPRAQVKSILPDDPAHNRREEREKERSGRVVTPP